MVGYDDTLHNLAEQVAKKSSITAKRDSLRNQCATLENQVEQLKKSFDTEQADVTALEGQGITAMFYALLGKKEEKLEKERAEAFAAKAKYQSAAANLARLQGDLAAYEQQLKELCHCEAQYQTCLAQKEQELKASGSPVATELLALEAEIIAQTKQKKEIDEAIAAANQATSLVSEVLSHLHSAENWGTYDLFGGGMISDIAKHDHLNKAQDMIQRLQTQLCRLKTELTDIQISGEIQVNVEGFLHVADFFFDGLFVDWMVLDKIKNSEQQVTEVQSKLRQLSYQLQAMQEATEEAIATATAAKTKLVLQQ